MKKKGFTLVELLAVIAILAILVIIALPNVLSMFNQAKEDVFLTEAKNIFKESASKYITDNMHNSKAGNIYCKSATDSKNPLDIESSDTYYYIEKDSMGKTIKFVVWNNSGYVTKITGSDIALDSVNGEAVSEGTISNITCENVLANLKVVSKLNKTYTIAASTEYVTTTSGKLSVTVSASSGDSEFNKVRYVVYKKNNGTYEKIGEVTQTNKSENFALNYTDNNFSSTTSSYYKVEAFTEDNLKIGEKEFEYYYFCFAAGTKVKTENGFKNIETIKKGDKVYSYNLSNNEIELKSVLELIESSTLETYKMSINNKIVEMTPRHQIYIIDKGWTRAYDVKVGDKMLSSNGDKIEITNIEHIKYDEPIKTYNLTVEDNSNYFVTDIQVLVHNAAPSKVTN